MRLAKSAICGPQAQEDRPQALRLRHPRPPRHSPPRLGAAVCAGLLPLGLFLFTSFFQTAFRGSFVAKSDTPVRLPLAVEGFLNADPFVAAMTVFLSTHKLYYDLWWSLGIVAITLAFGRAFCGWICPFGTLHHFFAWIWPSRVGRGASRVEANKTHSYQRAKYYLLYAFLLAAVGGSADPAGCSTPSASPCGPSGSG